MEFSEHSIVVMATPVNIDRILRLFYCLILTLLIVSCSDSSIDAYKPQNIDKREIVSLLIQYRDAKNTFDIEKLLSLLHEKGDFSFACGLRVSKSELKKVLPNFWTELQARGLTVIPMAHECYNGDYHTSGKLNNPEIELDRDRATATVIFANGFSRMPLYFSLLREKGRWLITRTEWGQS